LHTESSLDEIVGIGLIPAVTTFAADKLTHQALAKAGKRTFLDSKANGTDLHGYEIHMGRTEFAGPVTPAFLIVQRSGEPVEFDEGFVSEDRRVMGTYMHGIFDNDDFRRSLLDALRRRKGLPELNRSEVISYKAGKEAAYDRLAELVRSNLDMDYVRRVMGLQE
jgi:adenosylcobyric acid synthase